MPQDLLQQTMIFQAQNQNHRKKYHFASVTKCLTVITPVSVSGLFADLIFPILSV